MGKNERNTLSIVILLIFIAGVAFFINYRASKKTEDKEQEIIIKADENPNLIRKKIMLKDLKRFRVKKDSSETVKTNGK